MRGVYLSVLVVLTAGAQTKIDLRTQAKSVDFTAATTTKPVKTGTALPGTCAVGEMFFKTDAPGGANLYGCTETDHWAVQGGISSESCWYDSGDSTLKCRDTAGSVYAAVKTTAERTPNQWVDFISPAGVPHTSQPTAASVGAVADPGTNGVLYRSGPGVATAANADSLSAAFACQDTGAVNAYSCALTPPISAYTAGTSYWFRAGNANTGSATINFNGLGPKAIVKQVNQQLTAGDIKAGQWVMVTNDGLAMQMQSQPGSPGNGEVQSVFGRSGPVTAQNGDYTTAQVTESGNLYFTNSRAQAAFSYPGAVRLSAGGLDCPSCVTSSTAADTDLSGNFPHLSVVKLQGRRVGASQPSDQQYLGWNNGTEQWEPKALPAPPVNSIFGRSGTVAAQNGDYAFSQIAGAVGTSQLPPSVMRTDADNTATAGTFDMRGAGHTLPMKSGLSAGLPAMCQPGEAYFATDAPPGNNIYGCTAANTWLAQGTNLTVASGGEVVGWRPKINFMTGAGLMSIMADTGSGIDISWALDTATVQTQQGEQSGRALLCASAGSTTNNYRCSLIPALSIYTAGMTLHWKPDVSGAGGPTTLNVDTLGAVPVRLRDGVSDPSPTDIQAGELYDVWYDGARFRLMTLAPSTASGAVTSVFGRQGAIVSRSGDYTTDQVTEGDNLYFTNERAQAVVNWNSLADKPFTFAPAAHASTHQDGGSDEIATATPMPNGIPKAGSDGKLDTGWLPASTGGIGYTAENLVNKGQASGYAALDLGGKVPIAQIPALPYQPALGYTAENVANKGQANGYASLGSDGRVLPAQLPAGVAGTNAGPLVFDGASTVLADGSRVTWSTVGSQRTTSWTVPAGVSWITVEVWGAGGGGNGSAGAYGGDGGGGGGFGTRRCAVTPGGSLAIAAGVGGAGAGYNASSAGGSSSVVSCLTVTGGGPGNAGIGGGISTITPAAYGYQSNTSMTSPASTSVSNGATWNAVRPDLGGAGAGRLSASGVGVLGGASQCGGGGGGSGAYTNATGGAGGASGCGGIGGAGGAYVAPTYYACTAGTTPGGGGGGAGLGGTGGGSHDGCGGARGEVRVYYAK